MDQFERNSILTLAQHGFHSKRSCETQLNSTVQDLASSLLNGNQIEFILLHFATAFDKVPHQCLLHKQNYYGIRDCTLHWIGSFLSDRKRRVLVKGMSSNIADVNSGVPKGTVMGTLLFLDYINDLPDVVTSNVKLFADDCLIYRTIQSTNDTVQLQQDLSALDKWENDRQMAFHPQKCTTIHISKKRLPIKASYQLHSHTLEDVPWGKYLGITISKDLSWREHINQLLPRRRECPQVIKSQAYKS